MLCRILAAVADAHSGRARSGAALGGDLYERHHGGCGDQSAGLARPPADRAPRSAIDAAAPLGGAQPRRRDAGPRGARLNPGRTCMDFALNDEQQMIVKTTRDFVVNELYPHEKEVEETGVLRDDLRLELKAKAIDAGLYAANMPTEVGGAGLDTLSWVLYEKELGYTGYALQYSCVARPSNILLACKAEQRERYLLPAVRGDRSDCLAISEPGAG